MKRLYSPFGGELVHQEYVDVYIITLGVQEFYKFSR